MKALALVLLLFFGACAEQSRTPLVTSCPDSLGFEKLRPVVGDLRSRVFEEFRPQLSCLGPGEFKLTAGGATIAGTAKVEEDGSLIIEGVITGIGQYVLDLNAKSFGGNAATIDITTSHAGAGMQLPARWRV